MERASVVVYDARADNTFVQINDDKKGLYGVRGHAVSSIGRGTEEFTIVDFAGAFLPRLGRG